MTDSHRAAGGVMRHESIERLLISFSGGETSAFMTIKILKIFPNAVVVFANTGEENEETLRFVDYCDQAYGFNTVWVEAIVHHRQRKANTHKIVSFETAARHGEPYEEDIKKYGIPNKKFPHCTRDLKLYPIKSYVRSLGWRDYHTAIGIRADEKNRRSASAEKNKILYPLIDWWPTSKPQINEFWAAQPQRLSLLGYQGNCRWCWKKSLLKLMAVMDDDPKSFDFPERMERLYGGIGPEFKKKRVPGYRRTFFRGNLSVHDLRKMYAAGQAIFSRGSDDSLRLPDRSQLSLLEENDGCVESCEIDFEEAPHDA